MAATKTSNETINIDEIESLLDSLDPEQLETINDYIDPEVMIDIDLVLPSII